MARFPKIHSYHLRRPHETETKTIRQPLKVKNGSLVDDVRDFRLHIHFTVLDKNCVLLATLDVLGSDA